MRSIDPNTLLATGMSNPVGFSNSSAGPPPGDLARAIGDGGDLEIRAHRLGDARQQLARLSRSARKSLRSEYICSRHYITKTQASRLRANRLRCDAILSVIAAPARARGGLRAVTSGARALAIAATKSASSRFSGSSFVDRHARRPGSTASRRRRFDQPPAPRPSARRSRSTHTPSGWKNRILRTRSRLMRLAVRFAMQPLANRSRALAMSTRPRQHRHADRLDRLDRPTSTSDSTTSRS